MKSRRHLLLFLMILSVAFHRAEAALNFALTTITNVGPGPTYVAVADVNGDGKPDLICANHDVSDGNTLTVLTNNGSGVFGSNATLTVGSGVGVVVAADLNGDGKPDLVCNGSVTVNGTTVGLLTVLTNAGTGSFSVDVSLPTDSLPGRIAVADINWDGRPDLISAKSGAGTVAINTNSVTGFHGNATLTVPSPIWVVAADVNGDAKPDLIIANYSVNTLTIYTNRGDGVFGFSSTPAAGNNPRRVTVADLNGDGRPDLIVANNSVH